MFNTEVKTMLSLTCLINPLLILFTKDGFLVNTVRDNSAQQAFSDDILKTDEENLRSTPSHYRKREAMFNLLENSDSQFKAESYPLGKITFILSVHIAMSPELRKAFFERYEGYVPVVTQFLLSHLRVGLLPDGNSLTDYFYHEEYLQAKSSAKLSWSILNADYDDKKGENIQKIVSWFFQLHQVDSLYGEGDPLYFDFYTKLKPVPIQTNDKVLLGGLTIVNKNVARWYEGCELFNSYFQECCLILSVVFNTKLVFDENEFGLTDTEYEFHYLGMARYQKISKNVLFSKFLPFFLSLHTNVF